MRHRAQSVTVLVCLACHAAAAAAQAAAPDETGGFDGLDLVELLNVKVSTASKTAESLDECFPLQVLRLEAPARAFYDFYGV